MRNLQITLKLKRQFKFIIALSAVFFILQLAFVNCVVITSGGFETSQNGYSKGNGNGYVGIDAPTEVRAGSSFLATAYGGSGAYEFYMLEGKASITPIVNAIVEVHVSLENSGGSIALGVTDGAGKTGSARITLLPSDPKGFATAEPTGSSVSSMLVSPDGTMVFKNNGAKSILTRPDSGAILLDVESVIGAEKFKGMQFQKFSSDSQWLVYQNGQTKISPWVYPTRVYLVKRDGSEVIKIIDPETSYCQSIYPFYDIHFQTGKIVYFCNQPTPAVYVMNFDGSERTQLSPLFIPLGTYNSISTYGVGEMMFSSNGEYITFSGYVQTSVTKELYLGRADGTNIKRVDDPTLAEHRISNVQFSPDSSYLLYVSDEEALRFYQLYRVNSDHSSKVKISQNAPWQDRAFQYIDITPDSQRIAYVYGNSVNYKFQLYSNHRDGNQETLLSQSGYYATIENRPLITPDGQSIVFTQQDPKSSNLIYLKSNRMTGGAFKHLTSGQFTGDYQAKAVQQFALLPGTNEVVFTSKEEAPGQTQLYKIQLNGLGRMKLSPAQMPIFANVKKFVIAPDGSRIIYSADLSIDEQFEIYSVQPTGVGQVKISPRLESAESDAYDVNWVLTPDSKYLLFQADALYDNRYEYYKSTLTGSEIVRTSPEFIAAKETLYNNYYWGMFIDPINYAFLSVGHDAYGSAYRPFMYNTETGNRHSLSPNWEDSRINYNLRIRGVRPLNKALIYAESFSGGNNLWMMNKDGTSFVDLFNISNYNGFARPWYSCFKLSQDAKYIAFAGELYSYFSNDLAVAKTDGTQYARLTSGFDNSFDGVFRNFMDCEDNFEIAPDNSRVVYIADHSFWEREVWSVNIDGTDRKRISQDIMNPDQGSFSWPTDPGIRRILGFTPDSKWVFYYGNPLLPNENHLYAVSPNGGPIYQLTEVPNSFMPWYAKNIYATKDSSTIVYRLLVDGIVQLVASSPTGENKRVLNGPLTSGNISSQVYVLSDGETFIYEANEVPDGSRGVFRIKIDGNSQQKFSGTNDVYKYVISEDEKSIVYIEKESEDPTSRKLWEVSIDATNRNQIQTIQSATMTLESVQYVSGTSHQKMIYVAYEASTRSYHYYLYDRILNRHEMVWKRDFISNSPAFYKSGFAIMYGETVRFIKFPF